MLYILDWELSSMQGGVAETFGPRIVAWLRAVAREARDGGLTVCRTNSFGSVFDVDALEEGVQGEGSSGLFPLSEPAWKLTLRRPKGFRTVTVQVRAYSDETTVTQNSTFELSVYLGQDFTDYGPGAVLAFRPYKPDSLAGGPEARLAEVVSFAPHKIAQLCARTLIDKELEHGPLPPILKASSLALFLAPYPLLWLLEGGNAWVWFLVGGACMVWATGLEKWLESRWRDRQLARFDTGPRQTGSPKFESVS